MKSFALRRLPLTFLLASTAVVSCWAGRAVAAPRLGVRVKVTSMAGKTPQPEQKFKITFGAAKEFSGAAWSEWASLDTYKGQPFFGATCTVEPVPPIQPFPRLRLAVETAVEAGEETTGEADPGASKLRLDVWDDGTKRTNEADLFGPKLRLDAWKAGNRTFFDTQAGHLSYSYGALFKAAEIPAAERPKKIIFGDRVILGVSDDQNLLSWKAGVGGLAGLGINAVLPEGVDDTVRKYIRELGVTKMWGAIYNPPGYAFNFDPNRQAALDEFVKTQLKGPLLHGWSKDDIAYWVTSDEPFWYYPLRYTAFNKDPNALAAFHAYLKENKLTPQLLGKQGWDEVNFIGRRDYADLPSRRLFYWGNRFIPLASARYFAEVTKTYEAQIRPGLPVLVNFNNFMGMSYIAGGYGNNPAAGDPNAAVGQHDWMDWGRERASTAVATEDWFGDWAASHWSFYGARLRSAAELSGDPLVGLSGLIIPRLTGRPRQGGMAKRVLGLVGNGAKNVEFFVFGPEYLFPSNCWSENPDAYQEISSATRQVGKAEDLLFPGKPRRPEVAILAPQSSQFWDLETQVNAAGLMDATKTNVFSDRMEYFTEIPHLYRALQRATIPANFIDEKGLAEPVLKNYKVLYVTAPDLPAEATKGLLDWVRAGGILVTLPGAGQGDRYHQPVATLNEATGIAPEKPLRELSDLGGAVKLPGPLKVGDTPLMAYGRREQLHVTDAKVTQSFDDGKPAVTWKAVGKGRIMHFTFWPGLSHYLVRALAPPDKPAARPVGTEMRDLITAPVRAAEVSLPVTVSQPLVEALTLDSAQGVAVCLLNYIEGTTNYEIDDLAVTVAVDKPVKRVESVEKGKLTFTQTGKKVSVHLPLGWTDILKIYY